MNTDQASPISDGSIPNTPNDYVHAYLSSRSAIFRELARVEAEGWDMTSGDEPFQKQRERADNADEEISRGFFKIMRGIGDEMQKTLGVMSLTDPGKILDLCMAPGGYSASALKFSPWASVSGATLPEEVGGLKLFVHDEFKEARIRVWQGDLTSLVGDMGMDNDDIVEEHDGFGKFQKDKVWGGEKFDLVFCDGQVLRTHTKGMKEYRQRCEKRRLTCSQLLIALQYVKIGGTMVILLHKLYLWDTLLIVRAFDKFAHIAIFKPSTTHKSRGSFYLVAKNIQPHHENALEATQTWSEAWKDATFRGSAGEGEEVAFPADRNESTILGEQVRRVMNEFGERLITLGENAWKIQTQAIKLSRWYKEKKGWKQV